MGSERMRLAPERIQTCILYDPKTGKIRHSHKVLTYAGGKQVERDVVEKRALELAKRKGHDITKLKVLHLQDGYDFHGAHSVDPKTGELKHSPRHKH